MRAYGREAELCWRIGSLDESLSANGIRMYMSATESRIH